MPAAFTLISTSPAAAFLLHERGESGGCRGCRARGTRRRSGTSATERLARRPGARAKAAGHSGPRRAGRLRARGLVEQFLHSRPNRSAEIGRAGRCCADEARVLAEHDPEETDRRRLPDGDLLRSRPTGWAPRVTRSTRTPPAGAKSPSAWAKLSREVIPSMHLRPALADLLARAPQVDEALRGIFFTPGDE